MPSWDERAPELCGGVRALPRPRLDLGELRRGRAHAALCARRGATVVLDQERERSRQLGVDLSPSGGSEDGAPLREVATRAFGEAAAHHRSHEERQVTVLGLGLVERALDGGT